MTEANLIAATAATAPTAADPRDSRAATCVHQLIEAQAAARPNHIAVVAGVQTLTYRELNKHANQLARHLSGLGPDGTAVGLLLPRSAEFVIAALAVLKAGQHYIPLDADYPAKRLSAMLAAARCPIMISTTSLSANLPEGTDSYVVRLDALAERLTTFPDTDLALPVHPESLAYTMFTSGSTGVPKGVMITNRGLARLVSPPGIVPIAADDVVLHASSVSFDAATFDIWGALANGARLVIAPHGRVSVMDVAALLREQRVTTVLLPTGLFHLMVDERLSDLAGLRRLVAGGDVLSAKHARRFMQAVPGCRLVNAYGPTEVTVATTTHELSPDQSGESAVPIGRAMEGTYVRLLGEDLRPVLAGNPGQLFAGGPGLARGYLGDPALTAERFVPDPWQPGARIYATGDLARHRPDGTLEFLGRMDDQFKKRGFRVEPGEVEAALRADPAVRDAAVLADGATADTRRLVAVLLPAADLSTAGTGAGAEAGAGLLDGVRSRLRTALPDYLIPDIWDVWDVTDAFPLTANGKVDRQALLRRAATAPERHAEAGNKAPDEASGGPETGLEESTVTAIWQDVLALERVDHDDDFFDLGGHSLLANKVVSQVRRRLGVTLPLGAVFDHPTITGLAAAIRAARVGTQTPDKLA
ncbi:MAG TPA: non-ribosomal peptide synthetase [Actinocrinis sp.]|uniref:non-ribosomal peptide synthetase n=1 Tax=Actinocrinis sp. TaxID=1920516 RepID=UPI002DDCA64E|nr:non-ribosomal peptide synthetase [Actinocrinis sp.]HEV2345838.1 non-ribosomal peptide synthetase [Actinocrinis sp.]